MGAANAVAEVLLPDLDVVLAASPRLWVQCLVAAAATLPSTDPRLPATAAAASPHAGRKVSAILNPTPLHPTARSFHKIPSRIVQKI